MAKSGIEVEQVRPNIWVVLDEQDTEGGTIVRRFERWTCTCAETDEGCRHVLAARSLIAKAPAVVAATSTAGGEVRTHKPRRRANTSPSPDHSTPHVGDEVVFTMLPPRRPRSVKVSDRSTLRLAGKEVAA